LAVVAGLGGVFSSPASIELTDSLDVKPGGEL